MFAKTLNELNVNFCNSKKGYTNIRRILRAHRPVLSNDKRFNGSKQKLCCKIETNYIMETVFFNVYKMKKNSHDDNLTYY